MKSFTALLVAVFTLAVRVPRHDKMRDRMLAKAARMPGSLGARAVGGLAELSSRHPAGVPR